MIVRIQGEGQFDLPDDAVAGLNELDAAVESALKSPEAGAFAQSFDELLQYVRDRGSALDPTELVASDAVLPPADATEEEVRSLLAEDGLIPG